MGLQIIGRPFDEATVLRVGDAYERATEWRRRRPQLTPGTPQPAVSPKANEPVVPELDAATRGYVDTMVKRAGLPLDERRMAILLEAAPHALAMAQRVRRKRGWFEEPSLVFRFRES
jgi:aspartyl-tRNA(Asn)/glutamyl-tRNA(Gln) amidotransferase subunit A